MDQHKDFHTRVNKDSKRKENPNNLTEGDNENVKSITNILNSLVNRSNGNKTNGTNNTNLNQELVQKNNQLKLLESRIEELEEELHMQKFILESKYAQEYEKKLNETNSIVNRILSENENMKNQNKYNNNIVNKND